MTPSGPGLLAPPFVIQGPRIWLRNGGSPPSHQGRAPLSPLPSPKSSGSTSPVNGDTAPGGRESGRGGPLGLISPGSPLRSLCVARDVTLPRGGCVSVPTRSTSQLLEWTPLPRITPTEVLSDHVSAGAGGPGRLQPSVALPSEPSQSRVPSFTQPSCGADGWRGRCVPQGGGPAHPGPAPSLTPASVPRMMAPTFV